MALEQVGILVWNGTDWEVPKMYLDSVHTPGSFMTDRIPDTPALPVPSERYVAVSANAYQHQTVRWRWDGTTATYVEKWSIVDTIVRPETHGKVQYVLNGTNIDSSTTTYKWVEPNWVVDIVTPHAAIARPTNHGNLFWVDDNGVATQKSITYVAHIDNTVPEGRWDLTNPITGLESFDLTEVSSVEKLNNGVVSIHTTGYEYTFDVGTGWTPTLVNTFTDRPNDHDTFIDWRLDSADNNLAKIFHYYRTSVLTTYPATWELSEEWNGGQENRLGMTPAHGEVVGGTPVVYALDAQLGWVTNLAANVVTFNDQVVTHNNITVTFG